MRPRVQVVWHRPVHGDLVLDLDRLGRAQRLGIDLHTEGGAVKLVEAAVDPAGDEGERAVLKRVDALARGLSLLRQMPVRRLDRRPGEGVGVGRPEVARVVREADVGEVVDRAEERDGRRDLRCDRRPAGTVVGDDLHQRGQGEEDGRGPDGIEVLLPAVEVAHAATSEGERESPAIHRRDLADDLSPHRVDLEDVVAVSDMDEAVPDRPGRELVAVDRIGGARPEVEHPELALVDEVDGGRSPGCHRNADELHAADAGLPERLVVNGRVVVPERAVRAEDDLGDRGRRDDLVVPDDRVLDDLGGGVGPGTVERVGRATELSVRRRSLTTVVEVAVRRVVLVELEDGGDHPRAGHRVGDGDGGAGAVDGVELVAKAEEEPAGLGAGCTQGGGCEGSARKAVLDVRGVGRGKGDRPLKARREDDPARAADVNAADVIPSRPEGLADVKAAVADASGEVVEDEEEGVLALVIRRLAHLEPLRELGEGFGTEGAVNEEGLASEGDGVGVRHGSSLPLVQHPVDPPEDERREDDQGGDDAGGDRVSRLEADEAAVVDACRHLEHGDVGEGGGHLPVRLVAVEPDLEELLGRREVEECLLLGKGGVAERRGTGSLRVRLLPPPLFHHHRPGT